MLVYPRNTKPPFYTKPLKNLKMTAGKVLSLKFPSISDPDFNPIGNIMFVGLDKSFVVG